MISSKFIFPIIAAVLFVLLLLERSCNHCKTCKDPVTIHDTIRVPGDSKYMTAQDTTVKLPKLKFIPATRYRDVDSAEIIADYYRKFVYNDTVKGNDVIVTITDSLKKDSSVHRKVAILNTRQKMIVNPPLPPAPGPRFKMFIGFNLGASMALDRISAGPQLTFLTKSDNMYQLSYDMINRTPAVGMSWKIHFGKK